MLGLLRLVMGSIIEVWENGKKDSRELGYDGSDGMEWDMSYEQETRNEMNWIFMLLSCNFFSLRMFCLVFMSERILE